MVSRAIVYIYDNLLMPQIIIQASEVDITVKEGHSYHMYELFEPVWACRTKHGQKYGKKYIDGFKKEILEIFNSVAKINLDKMRPGSM